MDAFLKILETPDEMAAAEALQLEVWPGSEMDIVPAHLLLAIAHNGGLVVGAYQGTRLVGFVFGFPGWMGDNGEPQAKHCSHMLGVHPEFRNLGLGYALKRAQWQMVRRQGLDLITWTFDPLLSRNGYLNIAKLGAVCNSYQREVYGTMRDSLNVGLPSDRFRVDWWVNSPRVKSRLGRRPRRRLDLAHYLAAGANILNPTENGERGVPRPTSVSENRIPIPTPTESRYHSEPDPSEPATFLLVEIPSEFLQLKDQDPQLAYTWREHTRQIFESLFARKYMVTDFVFLPGKKPRSYYVLSYGESTFGG